MELTHDVQVRCKSDLVTTHNSQIHELKAGSEWTGEFGVHLAEQHADQVEVLAGGPGKAPAKKTPAKRAGAKRSSAKTATAPEPEADGSAS
jgi:hypothetical protein